MAVVLGLIVAVVAGFLVYAHVSYPMTSAVNVLSDQVYAEQHPHVSLSAETMAFLPYWRMDNIQYARYDLLSEVNFFSLYGGSRRPYRPRHGQSNRSRVALVEYAASERSDRKESDRGGSLRADARHAQQCRY